MCWSLLQVLHHLYPQHILQAGQMVCQRFYDWVGVPNPPLGRFAWLQKIAISGSVCPITKVLTSLGLSLQILGSFHCTNFLPHFQSILLITVLFHSILSITLPPRNPSWSHPHPPPIHLQIYSIFPSQGDPYFPPSLYITILGLCIVAWLSFT